MQLLQSVFLQKNMKEKDAFYPYTEVLKSELSQYPDDVKVVSDNYNLLISTLLDNPDISLIIRLKC